MLERLQVKNLGIIEAVEVEFGPGFSVLTGETGAGKSLLVESLKLVAGGRASADLIRSGADGLTVEARFLTPRVSGLADVLDEMGIDGTDEIVLRREVRSGGRSRCWANDVSVTVGGLQRISSHLLTIHGQHEHFEMADPGVQRRLVDRFGRLDAEVAAVQEAWSRWRDASETVRRYEAARRRRRDRLDAIAFQSEEIDRLAPWSGEEDELRSLRLQLRHAARLQELTSTAVQALGEQDESVIDLLARTERSIAEMSEYGVPAEEFVRMVGEARVMTEEVLREIRGVGDGLQEDPGRLDDVESRLHALEGLMLKYGGSVDDILAHREALEQEKAELIDVEDRLEAARSEAAAALKVFDAAAGELQEGRLAASGHLAEAVVEVLGGLEMGGTRLDFRWTARDDPDSPLVRDGRPAAFDAEGVEEVELFLAANRGEALRPMAKIASGGELSRIHLAFRTALRRRDPSAGLTLLFDEVDSGLGGAAATALAGLLADLAEHDQILVVTHLAQVAGGAEAQYKVEKRLLDHRTATTVVKLEGEARTHEVARMVAGEDVTDAAKNHAAELLNTVRRR